MRIGYFLNAPCLIIIHSLFWKSSKNARSERLLMLSHSASEAWRTYRACVSACVFSMHLSWCLPEASCMQRGGTWLAGMSMTGALYLSSVKKVISLLLSLCFSYTPHTLTLSVTRHTAPSCYVLLKRQSSKMAVIVTAEAHLRHCFAK